MSQVKIELNVDLTNPKHLTGLNNFLNILGNPSETKVIGAEVVEKEIPKKRIVKKEPVKKEPVKKEPVKKEPVKKEPVKEEESKGEVASEEEVEKIKITHLRELLSEKVQDNRKAVKGKLTELKAANLTTLKEEHYPEMKEFLENL